MADSKAEKKPAGKGSKDEAGKDKEVGVLDEGDIALLNRYVRRLTKSFERALPTTDYKQHHVLTRTDASARRVSLF